ncbi:phosphoribosyl-ATP pyrophosphohydrolase, partial [Escherichia coli]
GKILKSPTYSDVDLSSFVEQAKASAMYEMIKNNCR